MEHPKEIGDRTVLAVLLGFQQVGWSTFLPFGENTRCDVVVDLRGRLARVQCKTGRLRNGGIRFNVCSTYGHHRNPETARRDYHGQDDYFAVYCPKRRVSTSFRSKIYRRESTQRCALTRREMARRGMSATRPNTRSRQ